MTIASMEALRDAIRASAGPARELDATFARLVLGWTGVRFNPAIAEWLGSPPGLFADVVPMFTAQRAGPGALFAAARERWPECSISTHSSGVDAVCAVNLHNGIIKSGTHPFLTHALALAMVEAAIQERNNG